MNLQLTDSKCTYHAPDSNNAHKFIFEIHMPEDTVILYGDEIEFENLASELVEAVLVAKSTPCPDCISED